MRFTRAAALAHLVLILPVVFSNSGRAQDGTNRNGLDVIPHELEVKLALSALPPHLRSEAAVYVIDPAKGYVLEHEGTNGFTCYVERTDFVREDYPSDLFIPECFDAEGTKTIVPVSFDVARVRAEGKLSPEDLKKEITRRFKDGIYRSPSRPGISYMLSPAAWLYAGPDSKKVTTFKMPHFMFYAPNLTSKDIGGGPVMGQYPYLINPGPTHTSSSMLARPRTLKSTASLSTTAIQREICGSSRSNSAACWIAALVHTRSRSARESRASNILYMSTNDW